MATDDPRLDGIAAGEDGTKIDAPKKGKGTVVASKVVAGHRVFTIKWGRKRTACSEHDTYYVLKWAVEGQAASFEAAVERSVNNLCIIVCINGSLVPTFMQNDGKRKLKRDGAYREAFGPCRGGSTVRLGPYEGLESGQDTQPREPRPLGGRCHPRGGPYDNADPRTTGLYRRRGGDERWQDLAHEGSHAGLLSSAAARFRGRRRQVFASGLSPRQVAHAGVDRVHDDTLGAGWYGVADDKKAEKRIADNRKVRGGRMKIPGCPIFRKRTNHMVDVVQHNALEPVTDLISEDEVKMCLDVRRSTDRNTMVDDVLRVNDLDYNAILEIEESRLMPQKYAVAIGEIVRRLKPDVTAEMVALFSQGLTLVDAVLNACLRCQDLLGMFAFASYMMTFVSPKKAPTEVMEVVLPLTAKDTRASDGSIQGTACVHLKRPDMHRWLAVLLVLLRPLMREHLQGSGKQLCLEVGPFDANGKLFTNSKLLDLFQYAGKHFLGLPRWGYNINRTVHTSNATFLALAQGEGSNAPWVEKVFGQARQSNNRTQGTCSSTERRSG
ncbi:conserved unknown protein [Ectocarpus siliculosus]|uniref:Uncharacterized protein n=1 Tax=Ectocarpus siliculosus TaxID=2880 RepID=D7FUC6_ECTSI|nr:conserved unknown protein [Ectocarpus siliculosus]|eukprot:CBJ26196.1 conserved unknown protein [Ectocarpus siliculosus]